MRARAVCFLFLLLAGFLTLSLIRGQDRPVTPTKTPQPPVAQQLPVAPAPVAPAPQLVAAVDPAKLDDDGRQIFMNAKRGAEWLLRMNNGNGRFRHGWIPSLAITLEGDDYLRQVGAAFALARAARLTGEERYAAYAAQALLSLTDETVLDANDPAIRHTPLPSLVINRLGAAGLLVLAVNELPAPTADLLDRSEQLCNFIRRQARPDGSLACGDWQPGRPFDPDLPDASARYPGIALYALMRSTKQRPAPWKVELLRKAVAFYLPWWREHKTITFVPWQTAACAEAFVVTRDRAFADAVFEMADWLSGLQSQIGAFKGWADGRVIDVTPSIDSAACAEALALACRTARQASDEKRYDAYGQSASDCLRFLTALQYTDANTLHFIPAYRGTVLGGFHASMQDGTLRIDYTQHAVSAMALFLDVSAAP